MATKLGALLTILLLASSARVLAHAGHDHKVMGTVTAAAADHILVKDTAGKDVTIQVVKTTRVRAKPALKVEEIKAGTRVVVTAVMQKEKIIAKDIQVAITPP